MKSSSLINSGDISKVGDDILALSEQQLYAVGAAGTIIHSTDGGETWKREHTGVDNDLYTITCVKDGETLWVVGQGGVVLLH